MQLLDSCPLPQAQFASLSILLQLHLPKDDDDEDSSNDHNYPNIIKNVSSEDIESSNTNHKVKMVQCKTSTGTTKTVPLYPKGMKVYYKNTLTNTKTSSTIVDVHMDDLLEPYYTIRFNDGDGKEKQTDNAHLRLDKVPTDETDGGGDGSKDEVVDADADAYSLGPSISSDDNSSHNDNKNDGTEADKSAGLPPSQRKLRHAILKESLTVISPLTLLPEGACKRSLDSLHHRMMEEFDMRDDFMRINSNDDDDDDGGGGGVNKENEDGSKDDDNDDDDNGDGNKLRREKSRVRFQEDTKKGATTQVVDPSTIASDNAKIGQHSTAPFGTMLPVKIYQPPKHHLNCSLGLTMFYVAVYVEDVSQISSLQGTDKREDNNEKDSMGAFYNCASVLLPGMSLSELTNSIGGLLLGGSSGSSKQHDKQKKCGGVILLTIGATGPAYDLYGASSVIATLPERLRTGMSTLARVDTTPKEVVVAATSLTNQSQQQQQQQGQGGSLRKKKSKGKNGTPTASSTAGALEQQTTQQQQRIISYDATYFKRIYMALLATLIDDEDGLMRDHDEIIAPTVMSDSYHPPIIGSAAVVGSYASQMQRPPPSLAQSTELTTGLLASQNVTSSGTLKKKRFTFSRKKSSKSKNSEMSYESGEMISGGEHPVSNVVAGGGGAGSDGGEGVDNAEIVRRTAQQLEVLSLVEDDMDLPKYSHADSKVSRGGGTKRSLESPRRTKSGFGGHHYHAGSSSGRFGRQPVPSDLAGFEYRAPSSHPQHYFQHGAGMSSAGTANTSLTGTSSADDGSVQTGDDSANITTGSSKYTIGSGSQSSNVPTLSKPKRDASKTTTGTSRLRFLRRKKKENKSIAGMTSTAAKSGSLKAESEEASAAAQHQQKAAKIKNKPPLFPHHQQPLPPLPQHQVYDPFSMEEEVEEEEDNHEQQEDDIKTIDDQSSVGTQSVGSMSATKEGTVETPGTLKAGISEPQAPPVTSEEGSSTPVFSSRQERTGPPQDDASNMIRHSFSEDSEGVRTEHSQQSQSAASIGTESAASIMTEKEEAPIQLNEPAVTEEVNAVEPTRYLDVELALNEDLTCEYKRSKLSSLTVEGTVQVRVKSRFEEEPLPEHQQPSMIPFFLVFQDHSGHIKALQENKKFVENVTHEQGNAIANREFTYTIKVPREEEYFPVVRYKCGNSLRPVPIRVQSRVRIQGKHARIALQISSNPQNPSDLVHLTIIMSVPEGVRGDSLQCNPPGGVWNESKRVVLWCVSELGGGEKFQLQSIFDIEEELLNSSECEEDLAEKLEFPVLSRCQCSGAQLSDVALEVSDVGSDIFPAEVSKTVVQRFRVSHKESNR